jgi:hypothetical protein
VIIVHLVPREPGSATMPSSALSICGGPVSYKECDALGFKEMENKM